MNAVRDLRRLAGALAGLAGALLAFAAAAPAAFAMPPPGSPLHLPPPGPPGWNNHPVLPYAHWTGPVHKVPVHTIVIGGMPGWQITLIAAGAALLAAMVAVLLDRVWPARRKTITVVA